MEDKFLKVAEKLNNFCKEYDFYEYQDNREIDETESETIDKIYKDLISKESRDNIDDYLTETVNEIRDEVIDDFFSNYNRKNNVYFMSDGIKDQYDLMKKGIEIKDELYELSKDDREI